jgi:hypothetical protein
LKKVTISDFKIWVDDIPIPLIGGEVHYWRLASENWRKILERVKELNIQVVATYVCWDFHEYSPGEYDFSGKTHPQRNLTGFLDLLTEMGFWIIIRPGPYVYTEWTNAGVPDEAARFHRLHPQFLRLAKQYMKAVVPVLKPYFATNGGRIILFQADNEIDPWHQWHTEALGLGLKSGLFQEYLEGQYGDIADLNMTWSTNCVSVNDARAIMFLPPDNSELLPRYLDFCRFKHWFVVKAARWMVDTYQSLGVDVPIYLNTYANISIQPWSDLEDIATIAGPDLYPTNEFDGRTDEHQVFMDSVRYARSYSRLPYICEFESGIWHGWHYEVGAPKANHYRLMCLSALAAGVVGWNWYMLVNRDNWYMSPINEWGRVRPELFEVFRQLVEIYHHLDPTNARHHINTAVTFDITQRAVFEPTQELLKAFYQADIDFTYWELNNHLIKPDLLFYHGGFRLSRDGQERLRQYILDGGHLICLGSYPRCDELSQPLNLLEIPDPEGIIGGLPEGLKIEISLRDKKSIIRTAWLGYYTSKTKNPIRVTRLSGETITAEELNLILHLVDGDQYTVGFSRKMGLGHVTILNLSPSEGILRAIHEMAEVKIPVISNTDGIHTAIYTRDKEIFVIVMNNSWEGKSAGITIDPDMIQNSDYQVLDLVTGEKWLFRPSNNHLILANIQRKDATILKLSPM